ncbi:MAG: arginine--tRNA ligase, partial [Verrucomicrobiaceae bacterium]|nr:arginine--tRNA ligase [Verrucomicrobiaceae bacterium]
MNTFQEILSQKLAEALTAAGLPPAGSVTPATDARFGDYQSNAALVLAKQLGENPRALAQKILDSYKLWDLSEPPTIAGAGFINFTLRPEAVATKTAALLA